MAGSINSGDEIQIVIIQIRTFSWADLPFRRTKLGIFESFIVLKKNNMLLAAKTLRRAFGGAFGFG